MSLPRYTAGMDFGSLATMKSISSDELSVRDVARKRVPCFISFSQFPVPSMPSDVLALRKGKISAVFFSSLEPFIGVLSFKD